MHSWGRRSDKYDQKGNRWVTKYSPSWFEDEEEEEKPKCRKRRKELRPFSLDFLSKLQKQTIVAVLLFFIVLAAKYNGDPVSGSVYGLFHTALSGTDYSVALTNWAKGFAGGGSRNTLTASSGDRPLLMPINGKVAVGFGWQISAENKKVFNSGIWIRAPLGSLVQAPLSGVVTRVGRDETLGRYVKIEHANGLTSLVANLAEVSVQPHLKVMTGEQLGTLGFTAAVKQPWLYWEVSRNAQPIDPVPLVAEQPSKL
ncbi:MAG TPA: M23 family metallopeptidase [Desulfobacteria bacterium]|nr:M23 family metallopeptidase [Desulfobacteria bacterium]